MKSTELVGEVGTLTWLGHATVLLNSPNGTRVIFDPWLENPKFPEGIGDLGHLDAIAVTHGHFDHMGSVAALASSSGAPVICVPEMAAYFSSVGVANVTEMNKGGTVAVAELLLTMVTADHSCGVSVANSATYVYGGNPVGFVVRFPEGQGGPVYVTGDTNVFGDMALVADLYAPEIVLMPIDGHYNMGPLEAAKAVELLRVRRVAPIHYGTFPILTGTPAQLAANLTGSGSTAVVVDLQPGGSVLVVA